MIKSKLISERLKKGFSQQEISEMLYMTQSQYSRREKGKIEISDLEWIQIAKVLEVDIRDVFESDRTDTIGSELDPNYKVYAVPDYLLQTQHQYIKKLEEENVALKMKLKKYKE